MKKEKLFHLLPLMLVAALTFGFTACGDDDDDEGGSGAGSTSATSNSVLSSRLKDKDGNALLLTKWDDTSYRYDNGKLVSFGRTDSEDGEDLFLIDGMTYKNAVDPNRDGSADIIEGRYELNKDGLISKVTSTLKHEGTKEDDSMSGVYTFKYNNEKQLTEIKGTSLLYEEYNKDGQLTEKSEGEVTYTLTWINGNLEKIDYKSSGYEEKNGDRKDFNESGLYRTYTYGDEMNITKQYPDCLYFHFSEMFEEYDDLSKLGLFGVGPAYFPNGYTRYDEDRQRNTNVSFQLNDNGTIAVEKQGGWETKYEYVQL